MATLKFLVNTLDVYSEIYSNKDNLGSYLLKNHKAIFDSLNSSKELKELDFKKILRSDLVKENFSDFYEFSLNYLGDELWKVKKLLLQ